MARKTITLRIDEELLPEIDQRIALVNDRHPDRPPISRNEWFNNMARWTVTRLPHEAVRSDLIEAWPDLPEEALGIER